MLKLPLVLFVFIVGITGETFGDSCAENTEKASKLVEDGQFSKAIMLVKECTSVQNSNRWQALRITAIAYSMLGQRDSAEIYAIQMLAMNPLYRPNVLKDPKDFIHILLHIQIIPKFSIGLAFTTGGNFTIPRVSDSYIPTVYEKKYRNSGSYQIGLLTSYNINKSIAIEANLIANSRVYQINYSVANYKVKISETIHSIDLPLLFRFTYLSFKKFRFYLNAGGYTSAIISSFNNFKRTGASELDELDYLHLNSMSRRNIWQWGGVAGSGFVYKTRQGHISLDFRYYRGLTNITNGSVRYNYPNLMYSMYYLDDNIKLSSISLSLGFHYYINYRVSK